jgi:hypothetical protein
MERSKNITDRLEAMGHIFSVPSPGGRYDSITVLSPPLEGGDEGEGDFFTLIPALFLQGSG